MSPPTSWLRLPTATRKRLSRASSSCQQRHETRHPRRRHPTCRPRCHKLRLPARENGQNGVVGQGRKITHGPVNSNSKLTPDEPPVRPLARRRLRSLSAPWGPSEWRKAGVGGHEDAGERIPRAGHSRFAALPPSRVRAPLRWYSITCDTPYWQSKPPQRIPPPELLVREEERVACFPG
jgi:hypothetical protein